MSAANRGLIHQIEGAVKMKIPTYINLKINNAYLQQSRAAKRKGKQDARGTFDGVRSNGKLPKDEIILSPRATEMRELEGRMKAIPEVRQEKIEAVKGQIESKTYTVGGRLVAKSITDLLN